MKKLLTLTLLALSLAGTVQGQTNLGTITIQGGLTWDNNTETNLAGYRIYVAPVGTNTWKLVGDVQTNLWPGSATKALHGEYQVYATAYNTAGLESEPSGIILLTFRAGVPVPPRNFQLFTVVRLAATNAIFPTAPLPPIP